jgi:hypothetical protein
VGIFPVEQLPQMFPQCFVLIHLILTLDRGDLAPLSISSYQKRCQARLNVATESLGHLPRHKPAVYIV